MDRTQRSTVVGVFSDRNQAERAIEELHRAGFRDDQIGFLMRGNNDASGGQVTHDDASKAGQGAASGAITGGVLGGLIAAAASLLIPGFGPVIAGGLLASVLGGAAVGAAAGGVLGALVGIGVPEEEARFYESEVQSGRMIVTVKADRRYQEALDILRRNGAYDASTQGATTGSVGYAAQAPAVSNTATRTNMPVQNQPAATTRTQNEGEQVMQLREEQLNVQKQPVQAGEVQLRKEVVTEEKTINVPVSREEVIIERHPVQPRQADRSIDDATDNQTIRIPIHEEQVRIEKTPVVTEEVNIGKRVTTENRQVSETLRKEEVRLEEQGNIHVHDENVAGQQRTNTERTDTRRNNQNQRDV